jgi:hypothetical protein
VSAFRCTEGCPIVTGERTTSRMPTITARPSRKEKERFAELAARLGTSESALALIAVRALLDSNTPAPHAVHSTADREPATDRITIRLRPGDGRAIHGRAARRGFKPSAYIAALVRAHVARNPPLPSKELALLKQGIVLLARLGQLMAQTTRRVAEQGALPPELAKELSQTRAVVAGLEQCMHDLAKAALIAWESRYD